MFEYYNNILCIQASYLYNKKLYDEIVVAKQNLKKASALNDEQQIDIYTHEVTVARYWYKKDAETFLVRDTYYNRLKSNKINKLTCGGNGRTALIEWDSLSIKLQAKITHQIGYDPVKQTKNKTFADYIIQDSKAIEFFNDYTKSDGEKLTPKAVDKYVNRANIFNAITALLAERESKRSAHGKSLAVLWKNISKTITELPEKVAPYKFPKDRRLRSAYEKFVKESYIGLIHGGTENDNSLKIKGEIADWWLAMYCLPIKMKVPQIMVKYNSIYESKEWSPLTEGAVNGWLNLPEVKRKWVLARHGKEEYKRQFGHYIKRDRDNWYPNSYWAIDGSKLDWLHFQDKTETNRTGLAAKLKINPVIDVYSEKIIGWSYSETESHVDHFKAVKMAVNNSGARPYLFTYDNQSGHKSSKMQELYSKLIARKGGVHYPNKAYAHNSPVEDIFRRLQQQVLNIMWWSDKQSPTVRTMDNKPNLEFIKEFKHLLKSKEDLLKAFEVCVELWNNAKHPRYNKSRNEVYMEEAPMSESISFIDQVDMFWIYNNKPNTYKRGGVTVKVDKVKYEYEVLDSEDRIDIEFRRKYVGQKFYVKYDPEFMNDFIQLYKIEGDQKVFVANAQPKRKHESIPVLMKEGDKEAWKQDYDIAEMELQRDLKDIEDLRRRTGITPETLIEEQELMIKFGGTLPKTERLNAESNHLHGF